MRDATIVALGVSGTGCISTHASLAGRDEIERYCAMRDGNFNPRVPCGTRRGAARAGTGRSDFNPRVPCGTRLQSATRDIVDAQFQPTRPLRDATPWAGCTRRRPAISTHASLAGRDARLFCYRVAPPQFQPTRPLRDATLRNFAQIKKNTFQPTRPLRDATLHTLIAVCSR